MPYLILKTHMEVLRQNLQEIVELIQSLETPPHPSALLRLPPHHSEDLLAELSRCVKDVYAAAGDARGELRSALNELDEIVGELTSQLGQDEAALAGLLEQRSPPVLDPFWTKVNDDVIDEIVKAKVTRIEALQVEIEDLEAQGETAAALTEAREAWAEYSDEILKRTPEVFAEYVEFLGGLALRYTGFDHGICRYADELIHNLETHPDFRWESLTLPAREETLTSMTAMIGLGFPEWTIWALPLGAHAWGLAVIDEAKVAGDLIPTDLADEQRQVARACLADAFATFIMGPAYACAVILLRLDPYRAFDAGEPQPAAMRAQAVLRTLRLLNAGDENGYAGQLLEQLGAEWEEALRQAGHAAVVDAPDRTGGLDAQQLDLIDRWVERIARKVGHRRGYNANRWATVVRWAERLRPGDGPPIAVDPRVDLPKHALRDVLNAAWKARLDGGDDLEAIDKRAKVLWSRIVVAARGGHGTEVEKTVDSLGSRVSTNAPGAGPDRVERTHPDDHLRRAS
jgi:hypothetical protein